jgi:NtrC-family two-component system response regulator AlgB
MSSRSRRDDESPPSVGKPNVLVIDDEETIRRTLRLCLDSAGYAVRVEASGESGLAAAKRHPPDLVLVDLRLGGMDGLAVTRALAQETPGAAVIVMTAYATIDNAVEAMRAGASDYLAKPFTPAAVKHVVARVLDSARMKEELHEAQRRDQRPPIETASPAVIEAYTLAERAAVSDATLLILGETGTGKGVLARHLHQCSPRASRPFVTVNCATISPALIENELFGHAKGAYTGADQPRAGYVEAAKSGTLFIDEVGDLAKETQGKLLRLLEEREYVRVGDTEPRRSDARVVAATHRDLKASVAAGTFRDDLFYRLNVVTIRLPPLRQRREDIPKLVTAFLQSPLRSGGHKLDVSVEAMAALVAYDWPGNIRELQNVLERANLLANGTVLTPDLLPEEVRAQTPPQLQGDGGESLESAERRHIASVLARHPTLDAAAKALGIDPSTLYRKRERYGLR